MSHISPRRLLSLASLSPKALTGHAVAAQDPVDPPPESCPAPRLMATVGVAAGQRLRVSLFHHPDPAGAVHPCLFRIALFGIDGKQLGTDTGQILSGRGAAFDYDLAGAAGLKAVERLQFHGDVWVEHPAEVGSVMEIIDVKTGETRSPVTPCGMPFPTTRQNQIIWSTRDFVGDTRDGPTSVWTTRRC